MNEDFGPSVSVNGNVLKLTNAAVSDRGMYLCSATNRAGTSQAASILEVESKLEIHWIYYFIVFLLLSLLVKRFNSCDYKINFLIFTILFYA